MLGGHGRGDFSRGGLGLAAKAVACLTKGARFLSLLRNRY